MKKKTLAVLLILCLVTVFLPATKTNALVTPPTIIFVGVDWTISEDGTSATANALFLARGYVGAYLTQPMHVTCQHSSCFYRFTATLSAEESLDGLAHEVTKTSFPGLIDPDKILPPGPIYMEPDPRIFVGPIH